MIHAVKALLLFLILLVLTAPLLHFTFKVPREPELKGFYKKSEPPSLKLFTWHRWFSSWFQDEMATRLGDASGFRNSLIRISNQYDYSLFGQIHAEGFIRGKNRYLYEEDYIHEYTGKYFIGGAVLDRKLSRLKNVRDSLQAHNIPLFFVIEPGKASFFPEYIPERFRPDRRGPTNYAYILQKCKEMGLPVLDLNSYFLQRKDTAIYPLFPRYGMHWSLYGVPFAVDTLAKALERSTGTALPDFTTQPVVASSTPHGTDNDIGELLNLICPLPPTPGGYPAIRFRNGTTGSLAALVIADSYYINIVETYGRNLFKSQEYWYYNRKMYPYHNNDPPEYVDKTNLREKLLGFDVVLLMVSEINLHCGFWNFADEAFLAFHPGTKDPLIYGIENEIRNDREWFRFMVSKARLHNRPLEEMVREDAAFTFNANYEQLQGKGYWDTVYWLTHKIRNNAEWFAEVEKKAAMMQISVDSMLVLDAIYSYDQTKK
jgi:hypothetical protein